MVMPPKLTCLQPRLLQPTGGLSGLLGGMVPQLTPQQIAAQRAWFNDPKNQQLMEL